jgi:predicted KAP-like P-loop ATPase
MSSVLDKPITNINQDKFQRATLVKAIAREINNSEEGFNFLLSGEWGSGKTSILNLLDKELSRDSRVKIIRFNPWKYLQAKDRSSVSRKLLIEIRKELGERNPEGNLYESTTFDNVNWGRIIPVIFSNLVLSLIWFGIISGLVVLVAWILNAYFHQQLDIVSFYKDKLLLPIIAALIPLVSATIASLRTKSTLAESIEQFEDLFNKTVDKSYYKKILIFIDDLDRSSESDVQQILTSLFTVFENKKCFYVVAADYRVIEPFAGAAITRNADKLTDGELTKRGKEYLKKIFQFIYTIPPLPLEKLDEEVEKVLENYD